MIGYAPYQHKQRRAVEQAKIALHSAIWKPIQEGHRAFVAGLGPTRCPYALDTREQKAWLAGWLAGYDRRQR